MILPFLPRYMDFEVAGPEGDEEPSGEKVLRLIQIRLATPSLGRFRPLDNTKLSASRSTSESRTNALERIQIFEQFLFVLVGQGARRRYGLGCR
jgi:hypothetical protein